jgi:hypothetical protein
VVVAAGSMWSRALGYDRAVVVAAGSMWSRALGWYRAVVVAVVNKPTNAREVSSKTHPLAAVCKQLEHHVQRCRLRLSGRASWLAQ